jgi:hypothetical protein
VAASGMFITHSNSLQFLIRITDNNNPKKQEVMSDLLKFLDLVQKHADKEGCQHCLDILESVFER